MFNDLQLHRAGNVDPSVIVNSLQTFNRYMWSGHGSGFAHLQPLQIVNCDCYLFGCQSVAVEQPALISLLQHGCRNVYGCT